MKTIYNIIAMLVITAYAQAQNFNEALNFSERYESGSARTVAMAGAFGGLGANISTIGINPAGLGLFTKHNIEMSTDIGFNSSTSQYLDTENKGAKTNFALNNLGFVSHYELPQNEFNAKTLNFSFALNKRNDFNNIINIEAINNNNSMTDEFVALEEAGIIIADFNQMAYNTYLTSFDTAYGPISQFRYYDVDGKLITNYGEMQALTIKTDGSIYDYDFAISSNFSDFFTLGMAATITHLNYSKTVVYSETDINNTIPLFDTFDYIVNEQSVGNGISGKFGLLITPHKYIRFGGAIHTPSVLYISQISDYSMESFFTETPAYDTENTHFFNSIPSTLDYTLTTPFRYYANLGIVLGKYGVFDVDVETIDYSNSNFDAQNNIMSDANKTLTSLKSVTNVKTGLELSFGPYCLRGGIALYDNPYSDQNYTYGEYKTTYSGGIGLRSEGFYFDIAYAHTVKNNNHFVYYQYNGTEQTATSKELNDRIVLTCGFKF